MSDADRCGPTLVTDIGGTLLVTDQPGAYHRVLEVLATLGIDVEDPTIQSRVAGHVFTSVDAVTAAVALEVDLGLTGPTDVAKALQEPVRAKLLPGAVRLLSAASQAGWRLVAATNVASSVPDLPPALAELLPAVLTSVDVGFVKQDVRFWHHLQRVARPSPMLTLTIGDSHTADVKPARTVGYLALQVNTAETSTEDVADAVELAGPAPLDAVAVVGGTPVRWADRDVIESPHLAPLVERTTVATCALHTRERRWQCSVVRRRSRPPVIVLEDHIEIPCLGWLVPERDHRSSRPPRDLATRLEEAGLSLDGIPMHDRRHLVSLVREAKDAMTRSARIADVVEHLRASLTLDVKDQPRAS